MMFGVNARYPVNDRLTIAGFIINGYYHLLRPNDQPSYGTQIVYRPAADVTVTETLYAGPDRARRPRLSAPSDHGLTLVLLLTVMDSGDTPDYLARTHHIRRVPDF
jgi:hypothetical protein